MAVALGATLALAACEPPGPSSYGPKFGAFGYSDDDRGGGVWRVRFTGNSETPRETVVSFALYRAAEITLAHGFDHFAVMDRRVENLREKPRDRIEPPSFITRESTYQPDATLDAGRPEPGPRREKEWLTATLLVVPYRGTPPAGALREEDARTVIQRIGPMVKSGK